MKALKRLITVLLILTVVTAIILWVLAKSINPENVKNYVSAELSVLTKQKSKIEGDISWHLLPQPGIKMTHITIGEENNPTNLTIKIENLLFNLKITPLLRGKLVFNEMNIDGFTANINSNSPSVEVAPQQLETNNEAKTNLAEQFAIERLLLSRGRINIVQKQKTILLSSLQIGAEQVNLQKKSFPLQLKTIIEIKDASGRKVKAGLSFKGSTGLSLSLFSNPLVALQNMPIDGQLAMQNLKFNHYKINQINAHLKTKPGVLLLNPLTLKMYKGESVGNLKYEFSSKKLVVNQTATNIDSSKLNLDLLNKPLVKGSLDFSIHSQTNMEAANWVDSTIGQGSLTIKEGQIETIDLDKVVEETSHQINRVFTAKIKQILQLDQFTNREFFKGTTNFKLLTFQYLLQNAKLESNSLVLQTNKLQLKGDGVLHLNDNSLDSHLFVKVITTDNQVNEVQLLLGGSFPILIHGTLTEPNVYPDLQKINPIVAQEWVKNTLTKPVQILHQTLKILIDKKQ